MDNKRVPFLLLIRTVFKMFKANRIISKRSYKNMRSASISLAVEKQIMITS